jgi:hypothetical protein
VRRGVMWERVVARRPGLLATTSCERARRRPRSLEVERTKGDEGAGNGGTGPAFWATLGCRQWWNVSFGVKGHLSAQLLHSLCP